MILHTKSELLELAAANAPTAAMARSIREQGADVYRFQTPPGYLVLCRNQRVIEIVPGVVKWKVRWPVGETARILSDAALIQGEKL